MEYVRAKASPMNFVRSRQVDRFVMAKVDGKGDQWKTASRCNENSVTNYLICKNATSSVLVGSVLVGLLAPLLEGDKIFWEGLRIMINDKNGRVAHIVHSRIKQLKVVVRLGIRSDLVIPTLAPVADRDGTHEHVLDSAGIRNRVRGVARIRSITGKVDTPTVSDSVATGKAAIEALFLNFWHYFGLRSMEQPATL